MYWTRLGPRKWADDGQFKRNPSKRLLGAEIEAVFPDSPHGPLAICDSDCDGDDPEYDSATWENRNRLGYSIVADGSLPESGREIVLPPQNGDLYLETVSATLAAMRGDGATATASCGLHIHADSGDYTPESLWKLGVVWSAIEPACFSLVTSRRRNNSFCQPIGGRVREWAHHNLRRRVSVLSNGRTRRPRYLRLVKAMSALLYDTLDSRHICTSKYHSSRYSACNLHSHFVRRTVELRLPGGTVSTRNVQCWGMLWASVADYSRAASWGDIRELHALSSLERLLRVTDNGKAEPRAWIDSRADRNYLGCTQAPEWLPQLRPAA